MYLIAMQKGGYQAIHIRTENRWDFHKVLPGRLEVRIVLRVRGRRYLLYSTNALTAKYPKLKRAHLIPFCDKIIAAASERIKRGDEYIDFVKIAAAAECHHYAHWRDKGLISPTTMEPYHGHPIDPKTDQLVSYIQVTLDDIVLMDCEPPVDCEQAELPY